MDLLLALRRLNHQGGGIGFLLSQNLFLPACKTVIQNTSISPMLTKIEQFLQKLVNFRGLPSKPTKSFADSCYGGGGRLAHVFLAA
jgi:hypothetical protein